MKRELMPKRRIVSYHLAIDTWLWTSSSLEVEAKITRFKARRKAELKHQRHAEAKRRKANEEKRK